MLLRIIRVFFGFWLLGLSASLLNPLLASFNNGTELPDTRHFVVVLIVLGIVYLIYYSLFKLINYLHKKKNKGTVEPLLKNQVISL